MKIGYARVSTEDQTAGYDDQLEKLRKAGCEEIFSEKVSATTRERPKLDELMRFARKGDVVVVTKLDRLARSSKDLANILDELKSKKAEFECMVPLLRTSDASGQFMLTVLGAVAELEVNMMKERQRIGIAKAKKEGKFLGRRPTINKKQEEIRELASLGISKVEIAKRLGISQASVYRYL